MKSDPARILISGGSGLLGSAISRSLRASGYAISRLVRRVPGPDEVAWAPGQVLDPATVSGFDAVIHLAGESIMGLWTEDRKKRIRDSRVQGTRTLAEAVAQAERKPRVFISASAIGFYGNRGDEVLTEASGSGSGFLAETCREWEAASEPAARAGIRLAHMRIGLVLSREGGALKQMLLPFRLGLGGRIGDGRQWWSWIHIADITGAVRHTLENDRVRGAVNLTAPNPVTNAEFTKALGRTLSRPTILSVPAFALRLALGQMAEEALLAGARVLPQQLLDTRYVFQFADVTAALRDLARK